MFNFRPNLPWLNFRPESPEQGQPGFQVTPESLLGISPPVAGVSSLPDFLTGMPARPTTPRDVGFSGPFVPQESERRWQPLDPPPQGVDGEFGSSDPGWGFLEGQSSNPFAIQTGPASAMANASPFDGDTNSLGYNPTAAAPFGTGSNDATLPAQPQSFRVAYPIFGSADVLEPPPDRAQAALDEIASIYGLARFQPTAFGGSNPAAGDGDNDSTVNDAFDPRFLLPAQMGNRPPPPRIPPVPQQSQTPRTQPAPADRAQQYPGNIHNGPPGRPPTTPTTPAPSYPPPSSPAQPAPWPRQPGGEAPFNVTGPAAAAELLAPKPDLDKHIERIQGVARTRGQDPTTSQDVPPGGYITKVGVRMHPDVGPPAADELPVHEHLKNGVIGEQQLVNRIMMNVKGERVLHYGNAPGQQGADITSLSPEGVISVWDSKFRSGARPMTKELALTKA